MSFLADSVPFHDPAASRNLDAAIRFETAEAKRIQEQTGCTWADALRIVGKTGR